ncbi:ABC transporter permease, partial [Bacillus cereus]|uniref:ABC transporter permease n=1 Tax=Bacillus cereus TaxID=1396 RepID=UPI001FCB7B16
MIKQQFYKRLRHELQRKWKSIRSVTDWTVALYIIIPALIFMGIYYRSLWINELSTEETIYFGLGLLAFFCEKTRVIIQNFICTVKVRNLNMCV